MRGINWTYWLAAMLLALCLGAQGCAAYNYPKYAEEKSKAVVEREKTRQEQAKALTAAINNADANTRNMGMMGLMASFLTDRPDGIEAPREGAVEHGFSTLLGLVGVAGVLNQAARLGGGTQTYTQNVTGSHNAPAINTGLGQANPQAGYSPVDRHDSYDDHSAPAPAQ